MTADPAPFEGADRQPHQPGPAVHIAQKPRAPERPAVLLPSERQRLEERQQADTRADRSVLRGLLWLAVLALGVALLRAGLGRAFYPGWWRQW